VVGARRMTPDVSEALVSGDEESALFLDRLPDLGVFPAAHLLLQDRPGIVPPLAEEEGYGTRQVLVDLDAHAQALGAQWDDDIVLEDFGGIGEGRRDVL